MNGRSSALNACFCGSRSASSSRQEVPSASRRGVLVASAALALMGMLAPSLAQTSPCSSDPSGLTYVTVPSSTNCGAQESPKNRKAWQSDRFLPRSRIVNNELQPQFFSGFPMNLSLAWGPGPGDLPPLSNDVEKGSSPLVPRSRAHFLAPVEYPERATVAGKVDLITGSPLLQEVDLELPFGGAVYRHVRTYSEPCSDVWHEQEGGGGVGTWQSADGPQIGRYRNTGLADEMMWDWHGQGWAMGEDPIFLFDAAYYGINAKPGPSGQEPVIQRTCYFMPDAHRSIPFVRNDADGTYSAPPQFDAAMICTGGTYSPSTKTWTVPPQSIDVYLYQRTIRYHIELLTYVDDAGHYHGQDVPVSIDGVDLHDDPIAPASVTPGQGIPYYGLVKEIADRYGNRIVLTHAQPEQTTAESDQDCEVCHQNGPERGQLVTAKLVPAGTTEAAWTIVFVHRAFYANEFWATDLAYFGVSDMFSPGFGEPMFNPLTFKRHRQTAVHAILAYEGDRTFTWLASHGSFTLGPEVFAAAARPFLVSAAGQLDPQAHWKASVLEAFDHIDVAATFGLPTDWARRVTYSYADPLATDAAFSHDFGDAFSPLLWPCLYAPSGLYASAGVGYGYASWGGPGNKYDGTCTPRLVKRTEALPRGTSSASEERSWLYRYHEPKVQGGQYMFDTHGLLAIIEPPTVSRMIAAAQLLVDGTVPHTIWTDNLWYDLRDGAPSPRSSLDVYDLFLVRGRSKLPVLPESGLGAGQVGYVDLLELCDTHVERSGLSGGSTDVPSFSAPQDDYGLFAMMLGNSLSNGDPLSKSMLLRLPSGVDRLKAHDPIAKVGKAILIRRFLVDPFLSSVQNENFHDINGVKWAPDPDQEVLPPQIGRSLFYHPYRIIGSPDDLTIPGDWHEVITSGNDASQATRWLALISEIDTKDEDPRNPNGEVSSGRWERVVEMNAAGEVLRDLTLDSTGEVTSQSPRLGAQVVFDPVTHMPREVRSAGWVAANAAGNGATQGLIEVKRYDRIGTGGTLWAASRNQPRLRAEGFKFGTDSTQSVYLTHALWYDNDHPEVLAREVYYAQPVEEPANLNGLPQGNESAGDRVLEYAMVTTGTGAVSLSYKITQHSPESLLGQTGTHRLTEIEQYDSQGLLQWTRRAMMPAGGGASELYATKEVRSYAAGGGSRLATVDQVDLSTSGSPWRTAYSDYENEEPRRVESPTGVVTYTTHRPDPSNPDVVTTRTYTGYESGASTVFPQSAPVIERVTRGNSTDHEQALLLTGALTSTPTGQETTASQPLWVKTPTYDALGRVGELQITGDNTQAAKAQIGYDSFGRVIRLQNANGAIARTIYDGMGRVKSVFKGTNDLHEVWGTAVDLEHDPCTALYPDNMALFEAHEFGTAVQDAGKEVRVKHFRERPANQYNLQGCGNGYPVNNEDKIGICKDTVYDTRMRPVKTVLRPSPISDATRTEVSWLDYLGQERFHAAYAGEPSLSASIDPAAIAPGVVPTAQQILQASPAPLTLSETRYDSLGQRIEERQYDVAVTNGTAYTATVTGYDSKGRVVYQSVPNGGITKSEYDYRDLLVSTTILAGNLEVQKTSNVYDSHGRLVEVDTLERIHDASTASNGLVCTGTNPNAVQTRTFHWYDIRGLRTASVELGTENASDRYDTPPSNPLVRTSCADPSVYTGGRLTGFSRSGLPAKALITCFEYDPQQRLVGQVNPDGSVTRTEYDALGRVLSTTENALSNAANERRLTAYDYDSFGRLARIGAVKTGTQIDWEASDGSVQVTQLAYDADVVDSAGNVLFSDPDKVGKITFPGPTGQPGEGSPTLQFTYLETGEIASRTDARGIALRYTYDDRSNLVGCVADLSGASTPVEGWATDTAEVFEFGYDAIDRMISAVAATGTVASSDEHKIARTDFAYDSRGNLYREFQNHGSDLNIDVPYVQYNWDFSSASGGSNHDRLASMRYPDRELTTSGTNATLIQLAYGTANSVDDALSRVVRMINATQNQPIVALAYAGLDHRVDFKLGENSVSSPTQWAARWNGRSTLGAGQGYDALDALGRITNLTYATSYTSGSNPLHASTYAYDAAGHISAQRVKQGTYNGTHDNDRSWLFGYDPLDRLTSATRGQLDTSNSTIVTSGSPTPPTPRAYGWVLDSLSNWAGDNNTHPGLNLSAPPLSSPYAAPTTTEATHDTDGFNTITSITTRTGSGTPVVRAIYRDTAGNTIFDGAQLFQYDAFGHLTQISDAGTLSIGSRGDLTGTPGPWLKHFTYDALGRLIRTQVPWPDPQLAIAALSRRFYYDGGRRIQELITTPMPVDENGKPLTIDKEFDYTKVQLTYGTSVSREFIWDPVDTDRLLAYIDATRTHWFTPTDQTWTPVAIVTTGGSLAEQFSFDPQGQLLNREIYIGSDTPLDVGHQGLFFEPFYGDVSLGVDNPNRLSPLRPGLYFNRARWYDPSTARFTTPDPNATGMPGSSAIAFHGIAPRCDSTNMDLRAQYADGANIHTRAKHNLVRFKDPTGLDGWDASIDEALYAVVAEHAMVRDILEAANASIREGARLAREYERQGWDFADAVWERDENILFDLIIGPFLSSTCFVANTPVATPRGPVAIDCLTLGDAVERCSGISPSFSILPPLHSHTHEPLYVVRATCTHDDGSTTHLTLLRPSCYVTEKCVYQAYGVTTQESSLALGGLIDVVSVTPFSGTIEAGHPVVTGLFETDTAPVLCVQLVGHTGMLKVTPEHPLYSADRGAWVPAGCLVSGEAITTKTGTAIVGAIERDSIQQRVFNIEVDQTHSYFVGHAMALAHNECQLTSKIRDKRLVNAAEEAGKDVSVQAGLDRLAQQARNGNLAAGGAKRVAQGVFELRSGSGARLYLRQIGGNAFEIVAKSSKANQNYVIQVLKELFGP